LYADYSEECDNFGAVINCSPSCQCEQGFEINTAYTNASAIVALPTLVYANSDELKHTIPNKAYKDAN